MESQKSPRKGWLVKVFGGLCAGPEVHIELEERGKEPLMPPQQQLSNRQKQPKRVTERSYVDG